MSKEDEDSNSKEEGEESSSGVNIDMFDDIDEEGEEEEEGEDELLDRDAFMSGVGGSYGSSSGGRNSESTEVLDDDVVLYKISKLNQLIKDYDRVVKKYEDENLLPENKRGLSSSFAMTVLSNPGVGELTSYERKIKNKRSSLQDIEARKIRRELDKKLRDAQNVASDLAERVEEIKQMRD